MCVFENFDVLEIDLRSREVVQNCNLQEIEGFEIDENKEEVKATAFAMEKDVQLVAVANDDGNVFVFEYQEENEVPLKIISKFTVTDKVIKLEFVQYILVLVKQTADKIVM